MIDDFGCKNNTVFGKAKEKSYSKEKSKTATLWR